jgi:hypothetical protein
MFTGLVAPRTLRLIPQLAERVPVSYTSHGQLRLYAD